METYTICHRHFGYITHSYVWADSMESATVEAKSKYSKIESVMKLNK